MATTEPLTLPSTPRPRSLTVQPMTAVARSESPFTFQPQIYANPGQRWMLQAIWPPMTWATFAPLLGFVMECNGPQYRFTWGLVDDVANRGTWGGTPLVNGASQTGVDLAVDGFTNSVTGIVKAGDKFQLGTGTSARLYMVVKDANSNGSGQATLQVWPSIKSANSPSDNAALTHSSPRGTFRMVSMSSWDVDAVAYDGFSITALSEP